MVFGFHGCSVLSGKLSMPSVHPTLSSSVFVQISSEAPGLLLHFLSIRPWACHTASLEMLARRTIGGTSTIRISVTVLPTAIPSRCSWGQRRSRSLQVSAGGSSSLEHSSAHSLDILVSWYGLLADNSCIPLLFLACWSHSTSILLLHFSWKQLPKSPFIIHSTTPI